MSSMFYVEYVIANQLQLWKGIAESDQKSPTPGHST